MMPVNSQTQPEPEIEAGPVVDDERASALEAAHELADLLCGDVVLMPFKDGQPDWGNCTRQSLVHVGVHWTEIEPNDVPRLAVLTDTFDRFLRDGESVSVVTLLADGSSVIQQIEGEPRAAAIELIHDAVVDYEPLRALPRQYRGGQLSEKAAERIAARLEAANDNEPPAPPGTTRTVEAPKPIKASRFKLRDPTLIPPRQTLFAGHCTRKRALRPLMGRLSTASSMRS
jgi:hypothetical protein